MEERSAESSVRAYVTMVVDGWLVIKDIRIIECNQRLLVAMPNKERPSKSPCGHSNYHSARFCCTCGQRLENRCRRDEVSYIDVAHPTNRQSRTAMEQELLAAYDRQCQEETDEKPHRINSHFSKTLKMIRQIDQQ